MRRNFSHTAALHAPPPRVAARRTVFARRAVPRFERSGGFTLMELISAFVVFAIGFGVLLQILGSALHTTRQSAEYTQAALWAQSLLDIQGVGEPLKEGGRSGQFDDQFSYELNVSKYQPIPVMSNNNLLQSSQVGAGAVVTPGQMELYQLELVVSWGNQYLMHHARFVTLRVMGPPRNSGPITLPGFGG